MVIKLRYLLPISHARGVSLVRDVFQNKTSIPEKKERKKCAHKSTDGNIFAVHKLISVISSGNNSLCGISFVHGCHQL